MKRMHVFKQVVRWGALTAAVVSGIGLTTLLAGGSRLLSVQSGSMSPAINKGDLVSVKRTPTRDLRVGDVITFTSPESSEQTITHRIASISNDMQGRITTKGDANAVADQAIVPAQIVGKVEHVVPYAGKVVDAVRHPAGLLLIIYIPALILIVSEIRQLARYYRSVRPYSLGQAHEREKLSDLYIPSALLAVLVAGGIVAFGMTTPATALLRGHSNMAGNQIEFAVTPKDKELKSDKKKDSPEPAKPVEQERQRDGRDSHDYDRRNRGDYQRRRYH